MSGFVSRWVVRQKCALEAGDFDTHGVMLADVVDGWLEAARAAYLDQCRVLSKMQESSGLVLRARIDQPPARERLGRPTAVVVSAGATELFPTSITLAFRLRPTDGPGEVVNATCAVSLEDPATGEARELGDDVRDELIALEHAARHTN
jgi:acyl-CoA thioesterase FadM